MDLSFITKGSFGIIMRNNNNNTIVKQSFIYIPFSENNNINSHDNEVEKTNKAYAKNYDIFIKIIKNEILRENLALKINIHIPFINEVTVPGYSYIHMEYMDIGDLYTYIVKNNNIINIDGVLGCYFNGLYILHNLLNIVHSDITAQNILIKYIGPNYRQKIIYDNDEYFIDTNGFSFKISDFGLAENINDTYSYDNDETVFFNHVYRDYLLLFFLYFYKDNFYNYNYYIELIEPPLYKIKKILKNNIFFPDIYEKYIIDNYSYESLCKYLYDFVSINTESTALYTMPKFLLREFIKMNLQSSK
jgi:serine/threonine protein kinase